MTGTGGPPGSTDPDGPYRDLVEQSTNMVSRLDPEGVFLYVSPACRDVVGWSPRELVGRNWLELVHPDDATRAQEFQAERRETGDIGTIAYRFLHADGGHVWTESTVRAVPGPGGELAEMQASTRDITQRRETEQQLRRSEAMHRTLISNLPDTTVFLIDQDMRILFADGEAARRLPWWHDDFFRGRRIEDLHGDVPEDVLLAVRENYRAALDGERRDFEVVSAGLTFEEHAVPIRAADGVVESVLVVARDVSDRRAVEEQLRRSMSLQRTLTSNLPETALFLVDRDLRVLAAEGATVERLSWVAEDLFVGRTIHELAGEVPDPFVEMLAENYQAAIEGEERRFELIAEGVAFAVHCVPVRRPDGEVELALGVVRDVTERRRFEHQLVQRARQQEVVARLGHLALGGRDLAAVMDEVVDTVATTLGVELAAIVALRPDADRLDVMASSGLDNDVAWQPISCRPGSQAAYVLSSRDPVVVDDLRTETRFDPVGGLLELGAVSGISVKIGTGDRPFGVISVHSREAHRFAGEDVNFLVAVANLLSAAVDRHRDEAASRHAAMHDALTGLPNRTLAHDRLEVALSRRRREGIGVAALVLDLDRFKVINDSLGHAAGDEVLLALAPRLCSVLRATDTVARLGGDEFLIVCEVSADGVRDVVALAERIAEAVSRPITLTSGEHFMTASIGIALASGPQDTPQSLMRDADAAMYRAKRRGPGGYEIFDAEMRRQVLARLRTETELYRALDRGELRVFYQPVIELMTGRPVGVEALVRWQHPERGLVPPLEFIPIAEETAIVSDLGRWVVEEACRQGAHWQQRFGVPLQVYVNASGRQFANPGFPGEVAGIAERSGLMPATLGLEVTESVLMEDAESPLTVLESFHQHGLRLALDDFGTGYSSLSYLTRFPLDAVKIDRSFTNGLGRDPGATAIVKAVIEMCRALGITAVVEGVETEEQLQHLRVLGCELVQGYLFSRPRPAGEMAELLAELLSEPGMPNSPAISS